MSFATTWMNPDIIILSEMPKREKEIAHDIAYMWNLRGKKDTSELI